MLIIAGPCVLDDFDTAMTIADTLSELRDELGFELVFKASFDKANRTSVQSARGPGLEEGLGMLAEIKSRSGLPITTDIHESHQAAAVGAVVDIIQIPAFLARQTDLLVAAAATGCRVNVKKGQFMAPEDMAHVVEKLRASQCDQIMVTERGTFFGYGRLVNDFTGLLTMRALAPVLFDATHSVQRPSASGGLTGGNREFVEPLARAAIAVGVDGLFFETHPEPQRSPSDAANMVPLDEAGPMLRRLMHLHTCLAEAKAAADRQGCSSGR